MSFGSPLCPEKLDIIIFFIGIVVFPTCFKNWKKKILIDAHVKTVVRIF